ncbi:MAG: FAD-dependent oxidoreductase, partial [Bdellovibrio sp.]
MKPTIHIVGAGFAGMSLALRLRQKGFPVEIHEKSSRVGGLLGTDRTEYGIAEKAANALMRTPAAEELFTELALTPSLPLPTAKKRFLMRDKPRSWPLHVSETLDFLRKVLGCLLLQGKRGFKPRPQETLQEWGHYHLGKPATQYILGPAMQGIYGNDIKDLSATLILGPLFKKRKKQKYKGLLTGPGGMQDLVDHLEKKLQELGVIIHLNAEVDLRQLPGPVVLATSATAASELLKPIRPSLAKTMEQIQMSSLMSITLFFDKAQTRYHG